MSSKATSSSTYEAGDKCKSRHSMRSAAISAKLASKRMYMKKKHTVRTEGIYLIFPTSRLAPGTLPIMNTAWLAGHGPRKKGRPLG